MIMQGLPPRGGVRRKHGTNVRVDGQKPNRRRPYPTSGQLTAKSIIQSLPGQEFLKLAHMAWGLARDHFCA